MLHDVTLLPKYVSTKKNVYFSVSFHVRLRLFRRVSCVFVVRQSVSSFCSSSPRRFTKRYLASWSVLIQFMMCLLMPVFTGQKYTPDSLDGETKPKDSENLSNPSASRKTDQLCLLELDEESKAATSIECR